MKICKKCGSSETEKNRSICRSCNNERVRNYYKTVGKERRRSKIPRGNCAICGREILLWIETQTKCKTCNGMVSTSEHGHVTNNYERAGGGGYCFKHRKVASTSLGRKLESNEIVHHIDENPNNNGLDNLLILSRSNHIKLHKFLQNSRASLEKSNVENLENCWNTLRASATKTWLETAGVKVIKMWEIGQSAAEPLVSGEGSETMYQVPETGNAVGNDIVQTTTQGLGN